jgi:tetratricopeptide (TPR) repeat protein
MPDSALTAFQYAINIDSTYSESHLQVGEILFQLKKYPEAIPYFKYVIKARPLDYIGYDKLSYLYFSMKLYEQSIAVNRQALVRIPGIIDPYVNIGRVYSSLNRSDSALYYLHLADSLLPGNQQVQNLIQSTNAGRISP